MKRILFALASSLFLLASTSAFAAFDGYVSTNVYLRAGPDSGYPRVARLRAGTSVFIEGCVDDWSWCDVSSRHDRGWVSGRYLQHEYQGHRVLIPRYGVRIGIPIISFVFGSYWNDHYRSRSWYRDRDRYSRVTPRYYQRSGGSHDGGTYRAPRQSPVSPSRQSGATTPSYRTRPSTTIAPQHRSTTRVRAPARTAAPTRSPVERNAAQSRTAPQQQHAAQQQPRSMTQHKAMAPKASPRQTQARSKSSRAQDGGKNKGNQGGGKGKGKGKDKNTDQGGGGNDQR